MKFTTPRNKTFTLPAPPKWNRPNGLVDLRLSSAIHRHLVFVLRYTDGDIQWAADELGIDPASLYRMRKRLNTGGTLQPKPRGKACAKTASTRPASPSTVTPQSSSATRSSTT